VIGPASDGYAIGEALNADDAFAYHRETWARDELACAREFDLTILGGCCGTDHRSIEPLAKQAVQEAMTESKSAKAELSEKMLQF
jgi:S-methylmethionine-dependent homocysteine/selenocysteine methylase